MPRIHVGIRAKPHSDSAVCEYSVKSISNGKDPAVKIEIAVSGNKTEFIFDQFFGDTCPQSELFEHCGRPVADEVLEGFNGSIFAYGQTGAGKTFTVSGPPGGSHEDRGLCSRTIDYLFQAARTAPDTMISIKFSAIEIYNDTASDLLRTADNKDSPKLLIMDSPGGILVPDLLLFPLASAAEGQHKLFEANTNRSVAEHQLNRQSSRSHAIYTFHITRTKSSGKTGDDFGDAVQSKLNLVDLAGSERIEKSGSTGGLAKEAAHINRSLTFLEQVVVALTQSKRDHIPYRQSKLTYLLKDSLGGNCNTYLVACIWSSASHGWETLSTLRFASRMKCIENTPIRNKIVQKDSSSSARHLMNQIEALKKELAMRDLVCGRSEPWLSELSRHQAAKASKAVLKYVSTPEFDEFTAGGLDAPEIHSLSEARHMICLSKSLLWEACGQDSAKVLAITDSARRKVLPHITAAGTEKSDDGKDIPTSASDRPSHPVTQDPDQDDIIGSGRIELSDNNMTAPVVSFEEFKVAAGAEVQEKYDAAKSELKIAKDKQRQLVRVINNRKAEIDKLNEIIQKFNGEQVPSAEATVADDQYATSLTLIEDAKKAYREAHTELVSSKKEIDELQLAKKRCLADVVSAYEEYCHNSAS